MNPEHKHLLELLDKGTYDSPSMVQRLLSSYLPREGTLPAKWNVSLESDRGAVSFRSSNPEKLRLLILNLLKVLAEMHKELREVNPMMYQDYFDRIISKIKALSNGAGYDLRTSTLEPQYHGSFYRQQKLQQKVQRL